MGTNDAWLAQLKEEVVEPEMKICDPHHHLWGERDRSVMRRFLLEELVAETDSGHNIVATVFIEAKAMYRTDGPEAMKPVGEIEFANGIGAMSASGQYGKTRCCAALIGMANLDRGAPAGEVLDAMMAVAPDRFRGIRHSATW